MSGDARDRSGSNSRPLQDVDEENSSFIQKLPDGNLLAQILGGADQDVSDKADLQEIERTLLPVAAKYPEDQQLDELITRELVFAMVPDLKGLQPPVPDQLIDWVAKTLYADPMARGRLERLWKQLSGRSDNDSQ